MTSNMTRDWPDDETLMAFADGRLDAAEAEKVARHLAANEDARLFVERLAATGALARVAFDAEWPDPSRDKLAAMLLDGDRTADSPAERNVLALPQPRRRPSFATRYALPLAAAIALVVGGVGGYEWGRRSATGNGSGEFGVAVGPVGIDSPVRGVLEARGSGELVPVATGAAGETRQLMVIASFRDRNGRICREFEVLATRENAAPVTAAIACRHGDGSWHVEGAARVTAAPPAPDKDFSPASGDAAPAMTGLLEALGAKPALSKAVEDALLRRGWK